MSVFSPQSVISCEVIGSRCAPKSTNRLQAEQKGKTDKNTVSGIGVFIVQCSDGKIDQNHILITLPESII